MQAVEFECLAICVHIYCDTDCLTRLLTRARPVFPQPSPSTEHRRRSSLPYYSCQATTVPDLRGPWSAGAGADGTASGEQKMRVKCLRADRSLISPNGCILPLPAPQLRTPRLSCSATKRWLTSSKLTCWSPKVRLDGICMSGLLIRMCLHPSDRY
jgi:hypothetical protein